MSDARKDKRTLLSLKIRYKSATLADFIERYSSDISRGGVFIKAQKPLEVGTLLKFEFLLRDQSSLIHGVGRVAWRRDPSNADADNPAGMGIKFIKMDPESRALVQRIVEQRHDPGVFERGSEPSPAASSDANSRPTLPPEDRTKVRHVSEFLASAFEEGGAGEETMNEARAGVQRARQQSNGISARRGAAVLGALGGMGEGPAATRSAPEASSRRAMSAFGNGGSARQAISDPAEELDAADDFLDDEATRIQGYSDPDATVVGGSTAGFMPEPRLTPVAAKPAPSRLQTEVPDLFGPEIASSFQPAGGLEPAAGEFLDPSLLDPAVPTVPPPAGVPAGPGIPVEAFRSPTARAPAPPSPYDAEDTSRAGPAPRKPRSATALRAALWLILLAGVAGAGVAAWQFGLVDTLRELAAPYIGDEIEVVERSTRPRFGTPVASAEASAAEAGAEATPSATPVAPSEPVEETVEEAPPTKPANAAATGLVPVVIRSRPARAFVSIDGKPAGRAPVTLKFAPGKQVTVQGRARGYLAKTESVEVGTEGATVTLALPTLPYFVEVTTDPPGARVNSVGGAEIRTPGEVQFNSMLSPRAIVIAKDGYETVTRTVKRGDFREKSRRMVTSLRVELSPRGSSAEGAGLQVKDGADSAPEVRDPEPQEPAPDAETSQAAAAEPEVPASDSTTEEPAAAE